MPARLQHGQIFSEAGARGSAEQEGKSRYVARFLLRKLIEFLHNLPHCFRFCGWNTMTGMVDIHSKKLEDRHWSRVTRQTTLERISHSIEKNAPTRAGVVSGLVILSHT